MCNSDWVMSAEVIQNGGRRHVESTAGVSFGHVALFRWQLLIYLPNFANLPQSVAELLRFVKNSIWRPPPSWICCRKSVDASVSEMPFSASVPNFVQTYATATELWALNGIENGGRRHLEFTSGVYLASGVYLVNSSDLFAVATVYIPTKFRNCTSTGGWVIALCVKIQNGGVEFVFGLKLCKFGLKRLLFSRGLSQT